MRTVIVFDQHLRRVSERGLRVTGNRSPGRAWDKLCRIRVPRPSNGHSIHRLQSWQQAKRLSEL